MSKDLNSAKLFGDRLKKVMEEHGVKDDELAKALGFLEISSISKFIDRFIEEEVTSLPFDTLYEICECCNCSADYLLGLSDNIN